MSVAELSIHCVADTTAVADVPRALTGWFEAALDQALPALGRELRTGPASGAGDPADDRAPLGEPGTLWAATVLRKGRAGARRVTPYSAARWQRFLADVGGEPYSAELELWRLDQHGRRAGLLGEGPAMTARIGVYRLDAGSPWRLFSLSATDPLARWQGDPGAQQAWVDFLAGRAAALRAPFANIADDNVGNETALECNLGYSVDDTVPNSEQQLRGYSWVTVCSPTVAARLGGAEALRATGAFHQVTALAHGGLLLRATPLAEEYTGRPVEKVFHALAPALPAGRAEVIRDYEHLKLVYGADAADLR